MSFLLILGGAAIMMFASVFGYATRVADFGGDTRARTVYTARAFATPVAGLLGQIFAWIAWIRDKQARAQLYAALPLLWLVLAFAVASFV